MLADYQQTPFQQITSATRGSFCCSWSFCIISKEIRYIKMTSRKTRKNTKSPKKAKKITKSPKKITKGNKGKQDAKPKNIRGATMMKSVTKAITSGNKFDLEWNEVGQAIGTHKEKLKSYIGTTSKRLVPITYADWRIVPNELKDMVWEEVLTAFNLPKEKKKWLLKIANTLWRGFKTDLQRFHMFDENDDPITTRPRIYEQFITQDQWTEFITYRQSDEFKETSTKHKEMSGSRKYKYRGTRLGYAVIGERLKKSKKFAKVTRAEVWLAARTKKDEIVDEDVQEVAKKMDVVREQEQSGAVVLTPRKDVLAMALNQQEHPGRVRGVGGDVTMTDVFGSKSRITTNVEVVTREEMQEFEAKMEEKYREKFEAQINDYIKSILQGRMEFTKFSFKPEDAGLEKEPKSNTEKEVEVDNEETESNPSSTEDVSMPIQKGDEGFVQCRLFWPDKEQEVARGKVYRSKGDVMLHGRLLEAGFVKVLVETPTIGSAQLPITTDEAETVNEAVGGFFSWPEELVSTVMEPKQKKYTFVPPSKDAASHGLSEKNKPDNLYAERFKNFQYYCMAMSYKMRELKLNELIMGAERTLLIGRKNLERWLAHEMLEVNDISFYIRYLWDIVCHKEKHMFGFLCPASISPEGVHSNITDREKYVVQALEGNIEMKMFFAPYNTGGHWILMVICPKDDTIYYLDPLHGKVDIIAKSLMEMSLKLFWVQKGKAKPRKNTRWITVKGPCQPNGVDCGYYVLRYMREIIAVGNTNSIPATYYNKRKDPYTRKELDQIRVEWMEHFISTLNQEVVATVLAS